MVVFSFQCILVDNLGTVLVDVHDESVLFVRHMCSSADVHKKSGLKDCADLPFAC